MDLSLLTTTKSRINSVTPRVNGRFIATSDQAGFFYEMGGNRYKVNNVEFITTNTGITAYTPGVTETLYFNTTDGILYAWNSTSRQLEPIKSSDEDVVKFTAPVISATFADTTWAEITEIAESGLAPSIFKIGESRQITDSNGASWTVQIVGFSHDDKTDGSGKAGITFRVFPTNKNIYSVYYNNWSSSTPGYIGSILESAIATHSANVFNALGIASNVKPVYKQTYNTQTGDVLSTTSMTAFAFSNTEVVVESASINYAKSFGLEGKIYDYFKNSKLATNGVDSTWGWWMRSLHADNALEGYFNLVSNGRVTATNYILDGGVVFGFCL